MRAHLLLTVLLGACSGGGTARQPALPPTTPTVVSAASSSSPPTRDDRACGKFECRLFPTPEAAFSEVLKTNPLVLAIGEAHAQKGTEGVESSAKRFTVSLLPLLEGKASDLVVEIWAPNPKCQRAVEQVAEQQKPVTESQVKTAKNEFVALAEATRKLGIIPWPLRPTCDEFERMTKAGDKAIEEMLALTADVTLRTIQTRLEANRAEGSERMVVAYVGAMHNDLSPRPGRERYTYGPELARVTEGRYVELDLFVPEFIKDTEAWRAMPWYPAFDRSVPHPSATLFHTGPRSFVLVFPSSAQPRKS